VARSQESPKKGRVHRSFRTRKIGSSVDKRSRISMGKFPGTDLNCPSVGTRGRDREPIGISNIWKARVRGPFESRNSERILAVDLRKDACRVIIPTEKLAIRIHIRE
jgi:hypothetical protein